MSTQTHAEIKSHSATCFINSAIDLTVYLSAPMEVHAVLEALHLTTTRQDGKVLYPSMAVNLPANLNSLRFSKALAEQLKTGKRVVEVTWDAKGEITSYVTVNGNTQISLPKLAVDFTTISEPISRVTVPEIADLVPATPEELAILELNQKRRDDIQKKADATKAMAQHNVERPLF